MENCFRFLINVDQCLNMSYFDIFFYRLQSQHKFRHNAVQLFAQEPGDSLRGAVTDIRMYLDKYPYHVGDFQIVVAMRAVFRQKADRWQETMLFRLLQLEFELQRARIFVNSVEQVEKALNLVMLYDSDFSATLPELPDYKSSGRLQADCALLLQEVGIPDGEPDADTLEQAVAAYVQKDGHDEAAADFLRDYARLLRCNDSSMAALGQQEGSSEMRLVLSRELASFAKQQLCNYQIFEQQIDRNNRRQNILALLRLTEFLNLPMNQAPRLGDRPGVQSLSARCAAGWKQVWADTELEKRYADMLARYQRRLSDAELELVRPNHVNHAAKELPVPTIPGDKEIRCEDGTFSENDRGERKADLKKLLTGFVQTKFGLQSLGEDWDKVYKRCKEILSEMDYELQTYAENLSRQYAARLEERKQTSLRWKASVYEANPDTEETISRLAREREKRLTELKQPHMTPTVSFQDQLNMENSLEQGNQLIRGWTKCLYAVTAANFLLLILLCAGMFVLHYTLLQPYVFQAVDTVGYYLLYVLAVLVAMLLCWRIPINRFRKKIRGCVRQLAEDVEKYVNGYYDKAKHFAEYINLLNQLDYITRHHRLQERAFRTSHKLSAGYLWHKVQVRLHLSKLQFFGGLIELGEPAGETAPEQLTFTVNGDQVGDVTDTRLYWPQM